jgi:Domain of unknown function (DUF4333)
MLIVAGVAMSAAAGCGDDTLDSGKVEDYLRDNARTPLAIDRIDCPDDVEATEGDTFECKVTLKTGAEEVTRIRQEDDDGTIRVVANQQTKLPPDTSAIRIIPENVEAYIRANARQPRRILSVDCPGGVKLREGATFECVVRYLDESVERVEITQVDELGNVKITGARKTKRR